MLRALTDAEHARHKKRERAMKDAWLSGRDARSFSEFRAMMETYWASLGRPIPEETVGRAIREHGYLGLRALDVAADWTLRAPRSASRRPCPRRQGRTPRRRHRRTSHSSRASPVPLAGDDPEHHYVAHPARLGGRRGVVRGRAA